LYRVAVAPRSRCTAQLLLRRAQIQ